MATIGREVLAEGYIFGGAVTLSFPAGWSTKATARRPCWRRARSSAAGQKLLDRALTLLNPRERRILSERRLKDEPTTLEDLSKEFGISRERVRQIEVRAFDKVQRAIRNAALDEKLATN